MLTESQPKSIAAQPSYRDPAVGNPAIQPFKLTSHKPHNQKLHREKPEDLNRQSSEPQTSSFIADFGLRDEFRIRNSLNPRFFASLPPEGSRSEHPVESDAKTVALHQLTLCTLPQTQSSQPQSSPLPKADAVVDPGTMVIHLEDTLLA